MVKRYIIAGIVAIVLVIITISLAIFMASRPPAPHPPGPPYDLRFENVAIEDVQDMGGTDNLKMVAKGTSRNVDLKIYVKRELISRKEVDPNSRIFLTGNWGETGEYVQVEVITDDGVVLFDSPTQIQYRVTSPIYAKSIISFKKGDITIAPDPNLSLGAPDGNFVSIGNMGELVVETGVIIPDTHRVCVHEASGTPAVITRHCGSPGMINDQEGYRINITRSRIIITDISIGPIHDHSGIDIDAIELEPGFLTVPV